MRQKGFNPKRLLGTIANGIVNNNPAFRLVLGTCPTLAVTVTCLNGIAMGLATAFVLLFSNIIISCLRKVIPSNIRIPSYVLIITAFVTIIEMFMYKYMPDLHESLGVFIALIAVNCLIFARAEAFASINNVLDSAADAVGMGLGFTLALGLIGFVREFLGSGAVFGVKFWDNPIAIFSQPAGAFFTFGILMALFNFIYRKHENKMQQRRKEYLKKLDEKGIKIGAEPLKEAD